MLTFFTGAEVLYGLVLKQHTEREMTIEDVMGFLLTVLNEYIGYVCEPGHYGPLQ